MSSAHLQEILLDSKTETTSEQKIECAKLLRVVVKNLSDPVKAHDAKYRQLRLANEKLSSKLTPFGDSAISYLKSLQFSETSNDDGERVLKVDNDVVVNIVAMKEALIELDGALELLGAPKPLSQQGRSNKRQTRRADDEEEEKKSQETSSSKRQHENLSEKQKARLLMEQKREREAEEARSQRARNVAMLKRDKYVRENDENWTSGVSAACAKSGSSISTFRDRHGEN